MTNVYPKRFSNPETLRKIRRDLLVSWLRPAAAYLERRGFSLPASGAEVTGENDGERMGGGEEEELPGIDYDALGQIFMEPTPDMPEALVDSVFVIHGMANPQSMELLIAGAEAHGLDLGKRDVMTPADVAVQMWLLNPQLLVELHNSHELARPRSFRYFSTDADPVPSFGGPTDAQVASIEERMNAFYVALGQGSGARVFPRTSGANGEWWFLVRHGGACRREGAMENGEPTNVFYRPQKYDLLKYVAARGEMAVNCCSDRERRVLLRVFGQCLFGRSDYFPGTAKYTLAPLLEGRGCLACGDIPGIEEVSLTDVQFYRREVPWKVRTEKASDIFELVERGELRWPGAVDEITRATFKVKFWRSKRARRLTIVPCNKALYGRDSDSGILEGWLQARGFILDCEEDQGLSESRCVERVTGCRLAAA